MGFGLPTVFCDCGFEMKVQALVSNGKELDIAEALRVAADVQPLPVSDSVIQEVRNTCYLFRFSFIIVGLPSGTVYLILIAGGLQRLISNCLVKFSFLMKVELVILSAGGGVCN